MWWAGRESCIGFLQPLLAVSLCLSCVSVGTQAQLTHPDEVRALRAIKRQLVDPMKNLRNWDHGDPCTSNWTGIVCYNMTADDGYLHIRELELLNMNLSGSLSSELGSLPYLKILDFMWNNITGSIPKEIGNIKRLELLLLNGNQLTGPLPEELGYLPNLDRIQIDQNKISGEIPKSFAYLNKTKHFHMNNNSISGQIPPELSRLPKLVHFLLDNNNLSGYLPPEFSELPSLLILSLRNSGLRGPIPDLTKIPHLGYLDLSSNQLTGPIPATKFSDDITTIILSNNSLTGNVPAAFAGLPHLQILSLADNRFKGSLPSAIWQNRTLNGAEKLILLHGNPLCSSANVVNYCGSNRPENNSQDSKNITGCPSQACPPSFEYVPGHPVPCFCAAPLLVGYRLKSPGFTDFRPYLNGFEEYLSSGLKLSIYQLDIDSFIWQEGPRLRMYLKFFPFYDVVNNSNSHRFNMSEVQRIGRMFTGWGIPDNDTFGPYELLGFTFLEFAVPAKSGLSTGALVGVALGTIAVAVTLSVMASLLIYRRFSRKHHGNRKGRQVSCISFLSPYHYDFVTACAMAVPKIPIRIDGVRGFNFEEMALATNNFSDLLQVGQGGYGKVYKGVLADGTVVAIKRAQEGSLQGEKEFYTEIELLSRLHHRNLVSLVGYCDEEGEQMLVYEFMPNGTLREHISARSKQPLSFAMRLRIALDSAKGILYLHTEAEPPIFHRDIKASNILLDSKLVAKVADFGLSRLAPIPDVEGFVRHHVSTVVKGTPGYLDPEYFLTHKLTDKSDVYSLGVVFLELLTGMHPILHGKNIVREVNAAYQSGIIFSVLDERMGPHPSECALKFMTLALRCCQEEGHGRPSMMEVVRQLENISAMLDPDSGITESSASLPAKQVTPASPSSTMHNPVISFDVSGSDLVSGVVPDITPR
ncbi:hypothetical protein Cgig2_028419 [Carnegiea gigantea]|uniref:non-specific serine/threonine protein kinase n=1 Tax=Carnegiea gigantea TaxID=171969 RepID=A0A9Q1JRD4_9CARY|nr:hypothetical protein Cgig2_028419 [Carnegiea gigantea]